MNDGHWDIRRSHRDADEQDMRDQGKRKRTYTVALTLTVSAYGHDDALFIGQHIADAAMDDLDAVYPGLSIVAHDAKRKG